MSAYFIFYFFQSFETILQLVNDAFFKHGEKEALRSCVKAIKFCSAESQGELQDSACKNLKDVEDKLIAKLKSAIKAVLVSSNLANLN